MYMYSKHRASAHSTLHYTAHGQCYHHLRMTVHNFLHEISMIISGDTKMREKTTLHNNLKAMNLHRWCKICFIIIIKKPLYICCYFCECAQMLFLMERWALWHMAMILRISQSNSKKREQEVHIRVPDMIHNIIPPLFFKPTLILLSKV